MAAARPRVPRRCCVATALRGGPCWCWLAIAAFLLVLLVIPVGTVFITAFRDADGSFTLGHFASFFSTGLMRESFYNSLFVASTSVVDRLINRACRSHT